MREYNETVYEHVGGCATFTATAGERWSIGMLKRLKRRFPDEVDIYVENPDGTLVAHLPAEWMRIVPKRRCNISDERRAELRDRMESVRNSEP